MTPGVAVSDTVLNHRENNFVAAVHFTRSAAIGVAFLDISTGEFFAAEGDADYVDKLINNFSPKEVLVERGNRRLLEEKFSGKLLSFELDDWIFTDDAAGDRLLKQFATSSLKGFGVHGMHAAIVAAGAILHYLDITNHTQTGHITKLTRVEEGTYVRLDKFTVRNLELVEPLCEDGRSLLQILDRTVTPMGARLMRRWLLFPPYRREGYQCASGCGGGIHALSRRAYSAERRAGAGWRHGACYFKGSGRQSVAS